MLEKKFAFHRCAANESLNWESKEDRMRLIGRMC